MSRHKSSFYLSAIIGLLYRKSLFVFRTLFLRKNSQDALDRLGSNYGGWYICSCSYHLPADGLYVGVGVGEDISFDTELLATRKYTGILIDPTAKAKKHVNSYLQRKPSKKEVSHFDYSLDGKQKVTSYVLKRGMKARISFINKALWINDEDLVLLKPKNSAHVSYFHSSLQASNTELLGKKFSAISIDSINRIIQTYENQVPRVIIKMDIEGCELPILDNKVQGLSDFRQILVEFDFLRSGPSIRNLLAYLRINTKLMQHNFRLTYTEGNNHLFLNRGSIKGGKP